MSLMKTRLVLLVLLPLIASAAPGRPAPAGAGPQAPQGRGLATTNRVCDGTGAGAGQGRQRGPGAGDCLQRANCPLDGVGLASPTTLTAADLTAAVEEERVACDLYLAAAERWQLRVFSRIARAEAQHERALTQVAASTSVPLPPAARGVYATPAMQELYGRLLPMVHESELAALRVGALVEESDVADLRRLAATATDEGTRAVLANLERASARHLNAFVRNLARRGESYQPQVLTVGEFEALIGPRA